jgi:hypothetical protein
MKKILLMVTIMQLSTIVLSQSLKTPTGNVGVSSNNEIIITDSPLFFGNTTANKFETGRVRFSEFTSSFQGAFIHYNGSTNLFHFGVHHTKDTNAANDVNALTIKRDNAFTGIGVMPSHRLSVGISNSTIAPWASTLVKSGIVVGSEGNASATYLYNQGEEGIHGINACNYETSTYLPLYIGWGGNNVLIANDGGNVGIGTTQPFQKLSLIDGQLFFGNSTVNKFESGRLRFGEYTHSFQGAFIHYDGSTNIFNIGVHNTNDSNASADLNSISIRRDNGSVGIGTTETGHHQLAVEGSIGAREIKVETSGWSDFVFDEDYKLKSIEEVEQYVKENGHLAEIPDQETVKKNGVNLGEMNAKLLQKIEELTLYTIEQNKQLKQQSNVIEELKQMMELQNEKIAKLEEASR